MKPLHICYISQEYPPDTGWGGVGAYTYEMAHALADAGKQVTVITRAVNGESVTNDGGVEVHRVSPRAIWDTVPLLWRLNRVWPDFSWSAMLRVRQINRQHRIDVIEAAEVRADAFFTSLLPTRPKLITRLHTAQIFVDRLNNSQKEHVRPWNYWLEKSSIRRSNMLTAPSKAVVSLTRSWLTLRNREPFVIPNPIDERRFRPSVSERKNLVVYSGRLERRKGVHVIAAAIPQILKRLPATEFLFLGSEGNDYDGVSWKDKLLDSVELHQRQQLKFEQRSRDALIRTYQEAAVCILPSVWENFPYALLEAMACGSPVIATDSGGFPELIEHGVSGFLVPVNDHEALATRIVQLLSEPQLVKSFGDSGRRRVEEYFSSRQVVPNMLAAYERAIAYT